MIKINRSTKFFSFLNGSEFKKQGLFCFGALLLLVGILGLQPLPGIPGAAQGYIIPALAVISMISSFFFTSGGLIITLTANSAAAAIIFNRLPSVPDTLHSTLFAILIFSSAGSVLIAYYKNNERASRENLEWLSAVDCLTETYNHRYFQIRIAEEVARAERNKSSLALIFVDIDHFKQFNDQSGHIMGDVVLKKTAAFLNEKTRIHDIVCRYGGDEFVIILPDSDAGIAAIISERLVNGYPLLEMPSRHNMPAQLTLSIGVSDYPHSSSNLELLISQADTALYMAKEAGKNNVQVYRDKDAYEAGHSRKGFCFNACEIKLVKSYRDLVSNNPGSHILTANHIKYNHDRNGKSNGYGNGHSNGPDNENVKGSINGSRGIGDNPSDTSLIIGRAIGAGHSKMDPARLSFCLDELKIH